MSLNFISLAKTASFIVDNRGKTVPTAEKGIPLIKTNCITNEQLYPQVDGAFYISQEIYDTWFRAHPKPGDIILTLKGSQNGAACLVPNPVNFVIAQDMVAIRVNETVINAHYLLAALRSREVQHQIKTLDVSGVIPHLKKTDFDKLILPFPSREIQDYTGQLYYKLSSKIELLRQQNQDLEELAQTLFKRWFVEFEFPIEVKGKKEKVIDCDDDENLLPITSNFLTYKSSGGKMVESELGEIPEGWKLKPLESILRIHNGYSYKGSELQESDIALVTLKNFDRNGGFRFDGFKELVSESYKEKHIVNVGDLIVAHTDLTHDAEVLGNPAIIMKNDKYKELVISMDLVKVESKLDGITTAFLYYLMRDKRFKSHCKGYSNGTTVLHLSKTAIPEYLFAFPENMKLIKDFGRYAKSVYEKISVNIEEIQTLTQLRDTLLPKLMSGEIRLEHDYND